MELAGKAALITGGTSGIGAATALELAQGGADIVIVGRQATEGAARIQQAVRALGRRCELVLADVTDAAACERCVQQAVQMLERLDILVHAAGGPCNGNIMEVAPEAWHDAFAVHVDAAFYLCRAAIPHLRKQSEGAIILISSVAALRGVPNAIAYGTVKGAVLEFMRDLARDLAGDNIRVNCVAPGIIRTPFHAAMTPEAKRNNIENRIPLHREGKPEDVAQAIRMLVCNDFITGESITIDGGMTSRVP
ncbi:MAG: SDR family oxidoreductase [Chloroflexi bacterium]|nr:SDR family oxidoreductase [Chloroflexota bacterium]